jgi:hypothetical protein
VKLVENSIKCDRDAVLTWCEREVEKDKRYSEEEKGTCTKWYMMSGVENSNEEKYKPDKPIFMGFTIQINWQLARWLDGEVWWRCQYIGLLVVVVLQIWDKRGEFFMLRLVVSKCKFKW